MAILVPTNEYQTPITDELLSLYPEEVGEQLMDFIQNVEFISWLISPNRPHAKDCPHDDKGRVIVDLAHPHIVEDADYFRQPALHWEKYHCYTFLKPSSDPKSEYKKFWKEERRRCRDGYVRESDGEWVTGFMYWFLNYNPMMVNKIVPGRKKAIRDEGMPFFFEGIYWRFHYLQQARENGHHAIELAKRGSGKSYSLSAIMTHNLKLGESSESKKRVTTILTAYQKEYLKDDKDGTFSKFKPSLNFISSNTPFPRLMLKNSPNEMSWQMGYKDEFGIERGSFNTVLGVSAKDDPDKLRGKRGWVLFEEMGAFKGLLALYDTTRRGCEDGDYTFATMYLLGTANESESDFSSAKTLLYSPGSYNIQEIKNVYDKPKQGRPTFGYFFPAYINRAGCYNKDGVSDVVKALLEILMARYKAKYGADPKSVLRVIAEDPITPAEAIVKVKAAYFPIAQLNERILQLDSDPTAYDDVYIGALALNKSGEVVFKPTNDIPIRKWGVANDTPGAIEIFNMPEKDSQGNIFNGRYIIGHDPVDNDQAESSSLSSTFVFDLFTDRIVAEFTGRKAFADDNFEIVRLLCIFYNAKCLYEAHPYDQVVKTPSGDKLWKDINVGDELFSIDGSTTKVIDIPIDGVDDIYRLTLEDGRLVEASKNHIWSIYDAFNDRNNLKNVTTEYFLQKNLVNKHGQRRYYLPDNAAIHYPHKDVPIDPYTMGLLLAEGAFTKFRKNKCRNRAKNFVQFSSSKEDALFYSSVIPYPIKYIGTKGCSWHLYLDNIDSILDSLCLLFKDSSTKFIPDLYIYNDYNTRLELLKGLMDGDGCAVKSGASVFVTVSHRLSEDIKLLCRSLGIKAYNNLCREATEHSKKAYRVAIASTIPIFKLPRKVIKQHVYLPNSIGSKANGFLNRTAIVKIEYVGKKPCKCVTVDRKDGLYLVGDYIVTHNCNKKGMYAYFAKMNSLQYLAETPQYLRDMQIVKYSSFGSNKYGVNASAAINDYANNQIKEWLIKPIPVVTKDEDGNDIETTLPTLMTVRNRALLDELVNFTPEVNVDRIRALGMVMLLRQEKIILYQGDMSRVLQDEGIDNLANDNFFKTNYDDRFHNDFSNPDMEW